MRSSTGDPGNPFAPPQADTVPSLVPGIGERIVGGQCPRIPSFLCEEISFLHIFDDLLHQFPPALHYNFKSCHRSISSSSAKSSSSVRGPSGIIPNLFLILCISPPWEAPSPGLFVWIPPSFFTGQVLSFPEVSSQGAPGVSPRYTPLIPWISFQTHIHYRKENPCG